MRNIRHLRVFLAAVRSGSVSKSAEASLVSQPAVTQALAKLEGGYGGPLLMRTRAGIETNVRGAVLANRVARALAILDDGLMQVSSRLVVTATTAQLRALVAVRDAENISRAARTLGLAQPTVQRAIAQLEQEAARPLFERTPHGLVPTRPCQRLAQAVRLAFAELDQADAELAELEGKTAGRIVVGALPLSRSVILPKALTAFRTQRPTQAVIILDGTYEEMLGALRRGDIDMMVGALRDPLPVSDIVQEHLFDDRLAIIAGRHHPLAGKQKIPVSALAGPGWLVPRKGTPTRAQFDSLFEGHPYPQCIIETGSILLMREMLRNGEGLGCISSAQAAAEITNGMLASLDIDFEWPTRPIGISYRAGWMPTAAQSVLLDFIREAAASRG
ncbi:LysR family transcriptional regulator [Pelagibacterium limicola]|uniref:LysR family transcriptional regulator n=1 Tax=Pelagibacterium limicola TaxID=2791022 RepID=UPI0018B00735|nr:LysR family transcriptional regulator [Pelagibacterium limicola]